MLLAALAIGLDTFAAALLAAYRGGLGLSGETPDDAGRLIALSQPFGRVETQL